MISLDKNLLGLQIFNLLDPSVCDMLSERLEYIKNNNLSENINNTCFKSDGYQSGNLLDVPDYQLLEFSLRLKFSLSEKFHCHQSDLDFVFLHFLDYGKIGHMEEHDHKDKEDLTFLLYLNDCSDGGTEFYLNNANADSKKRSTFTVIPKKGKMAVFSSLISHRGLESLQGKKILAGGLKYNLFVNREF